MKPFSLEDLKAKPILANALFMEKHSDYLSRKDYYQRDVISLIPVDTKNSLHDEELASCNKLGILAKNYYLSSPLLTEIPEARQYIQEAVLLRRSVLQRLLLVDNYLREYGLRLIILSGYRHPELQRLILERARVVAGDDVANKMFANAKYYAPHASGAAFDLELWDEQSQTILPTKTKRGIDRFCLEGQNDLTSDELVARDNRRILHHLLATDVLLGKDAFIAHPFEYWHYGCYERLSSFFFCKHNYEVYYDQIYHI